LKGNKQSEIGRIPVKGKFGNSEWEYGCSRISRKLNSTNETRIAMTVVVMNLKKVRLIFFCLFFSLLWRFGFLFFGRLKIA